VRSPVPTLASLVFVASSACAGGDGGPVEIGRDGQDEEESIGDVVYADGEREPDPEAGAATMPLIATVGAAARGGTCSTNVVRGLSQQLVDEIACVRPGVLASIEGIPNVTLQSAVFPYLQTPAADALRAAGTGGTRLTVASALRTLPQQYLLYQWYRRRRCSIPAAAPPGSSNHEQALAVDVGERGNVRTAMQSRGFRWFGSRDRVHYDYTGSAGEDIANLSVLAFQRLWNRNHPEDRIEETGRYGTQVARRLEMSPPTGFPMGASCAPFVATTNLAPVAADPCREAGACADCIATDPTCAFCLATGRCQTIGAGACGSGFADRVDACPADPPLDPAAPAMCVPIADDCRTDAECCDAPAGEGICVVGFCAIHNGCGREGSVCEGASSGSCCGQLACLPYVIGGMAECCARGNDPCTSSDDCCGAMSCDGGRCTCRRSGERCVNGSDCCGASFCNAGTCS
jgi:hypothetical protein